MQHWGIYSLLSQPEAEVRSDCLATWLYSGVIVIVMHTLLNFYGQSQSTRNSAVYAEIGPIPKGKKAVVMPDTTVQYAVVKKKQQQQQCETGKV